VANYNTRFNTWRVIYSVTFSRCSACWISVALSINSLLTCLNKTEKLKYRVQQKQKWMSTVSHTNRQRQAVHTKCNICTLYSTSSSAIHQQCIFSVQSGVIRWISLYTYTRPVWHQCLRTFFLSDSLAVAFASVPQY